MSASPGDYEKGVDHLTNAIAVCGQPQQLLQVLQQTLPPPVFQMLLTKLPTISQVASVQGRPGSTRVSLGQPGSTRVRLTSVSPQRIVSAQNLNEDDIE